MEKDNLKNGEYRMKNTKPKIFKIVNCQSSIVNHEWGFTLLEVMVAIVILGLGLTVVFELFSGGLKSVEISNDYSNAVILANKKMSELSLKEMLKAGKEEGDFPGEEKYKWEVEIIPYKVDEKTRFFADAQNDRREGAHNDNPVKIYRLDVRVFWKTGLTEKDVRLTSLRTFMEKPTEEAATK
ncbi:MAG: prepilin-type N-terminal cleavage/methylation domain-containing protein [Nitrospinae bacterium]|nr:prepilin-type N-terminal cleavage/methylation domain-containing protein [Nitrospinota bacterium]